MNFYKVALAILLCQLSTHLTWESCTCVLVLSPIVWCVCVCTIDCIKRVCTPLDAAVLVERRWPCSDSKVLMTPFSLQCDFVCELQEEPWNVSQVLVVLVSLCCQQKCSAFTNELFVSCHLRFLVWIIFFLHNLHLICFFFCVSSRSVRCYS